MPATLTVKDETTGGQTFDAITLEFLTEHITVRELIRKRVYLPYEGDRTMAIILSKAFLLADDDKITDRTILSQIGRR